MLKGFMMLYTVVRALGSVRNTLAGCQKKATVRFDAHRPQTFGLGANLLEFGLQSFRAADMLNHELQRLNVCKTKDPVAQPWDKGETERRFSSLSFHEPVVMTSRCDVPAGVVAGGSIAP